MCKKSANILGISLDLFLRFLFYVQTLHRLTAKGVISDWESGMLDEDETKHEVCSMFDVHLCGVM